VALRGLIRRRDRRLPADVLAALRCRRCRSKPAAALLTNARDQSDIHAWQTRETGKGRLQLVLWMMPHGNKAQQTPWADFASAALWWRLGRRKSLDLQSEIR